MFDITIKGDECIIPTSQLIELLEYRLDALIIVKNNDSSWNYPIEEMEEQIAELKATL